MHSSKVFKKTKLSITFCIVVREQLDVKLLCECRQVRRHHAAGGQVDLVTAGLHLVTVRVAHDFWQSWRVGSCDRRAQTRTSVTPEPSCRAAPVDLCPGRRFRWRQSAGSSPGPPTAPRLAEGAPGSGFHPPPALVALWWLSPVGTQPASGTLRRETCRE